MPRKLLDLPPPTILIPHRHYGLVAPVNLVLYNLTSLAITSASLGSVAEGALTPFSPTAPVASLAATAPSPTFLLQIVFSDQSGWYRAVTSNFDAATTLWIWCYRNGFVLTDPAGKAGQISFGT
jgi:hypothetical protein